MGIDKPGTLSNGITFGRDQMFAGDGSGQTIAIVDAYDDPNAVSDLNAFSTYYGLPTFGRAAGGPTFPNSTRPAARRCRAPTPTAQRIYDWEMEESLDIEWAHVMAPMANIILYEANTPRRSIHGDLRPPRTVGRGRRFDELESARVLRRGQLRLHATSSPRRATSAAPLRTAAPICRAASPSWPPPATTALMPTSTATSRPNIRPLRPTWSPSAGPLYRQRKQLRQRGSGQWRQQRHVRRRRRRHQRLRIPTVLTKRRAMPSAPANALIRRSADANPNTGVPIYDSYDFGSFHPVDRPSAARAWPAPCGPASLPRRRGPAIAGLGVAGRHADLAALYSPRPRPVSTTSPPATASAPPAAPPAISPGQDSIWPRASAARQGPAGPATGRNSQRDHRPEQSNGRGGQHGELDGGGRRLPCHRAVGTEQRRRNELQPHQRRDLGHLQLHGQHAAKRLRV